MFHSDQGTLPLPRKNLTHCPGYLDHYGVFRERLVQANVEHPIFAEVQRQLQAHGFRAREGQIIDASIVRVPTQHHTAEEQAVVKEKAVPIEWSPAKRRQKDVDARWTKKHGQSYFGYKLSVSVDRRQKLIRPSDLNL